MVRIVLCLIALLLPGTVRAQDGKRPPAPPAAALATPGGAGFVVDAASGCWLWSRVVPPGATARWSGPCPGGPATGRGEMEWRVPRPEGDLVIRYTGDLVAGRMHGRGTYLYADGSRYEGEFREHVQQGQGRYEWRDGRSYAGQVVAGLPSGRGVGREPGGARYEGEWRGGRPNGQGIWHDAAGNDLATGWRAGCASAGGRVLSFFRPLAECQALLDRNSSA